MARNRGFEVVLLALASWAISACANGSHEGSRAPATGGSANGKVAGADATGGAAAGMPTKGGAGSAAGRASAGPWTFPAGVTKPRIMIVGDSISAGPGCYKKFLLKALTDNHYSSFQFVGEYSDDCGGGVRHSAVSCSTATQYTQSMFSMPNCAQDKTFPGIATLVATHKPDLLMLQLGVNDVWGGKGPNDILGDYAKLVAQARAHNANVVLVVARIAKIRPACNADETVTKRAEALVNAVPTWAQQQSLAQSPVFVADLWTNSDWSRAETLDCVHPNDVGAERMGMNWFNALKGILKPN